MRCEICGGTTTKRKVNKLHRFQGQFYFVEDVEAEVCQNCGERYYHATTLDAIDQGLAEGSLIIKRQFQVQVVGMPTRT